MRHPDPFSFVRVFIKLPVALTDKGSAMLFLKSIYGGHEVQVCPHIEGTLRRSNSLIDGGEHACDTRARFPLCIFLFSRRLTDKGSAMLLLNSIYG